MRNLLVPFGTLLLLIPGIALANNIITQKDIHIEIVADDGRVFPVHDLRQSSQNEFRSYLEANYGENYGIRVHNLTAKRVGLVIAVDGRNIISGQKSYLKPSERMYILGPYEQASYDGWRTSNHKINRFYFTDSGDSYAGAWNDYSAMGVIALAVYPEKQRYRSQSKLKEKKFGRNHRSYDAPMELPSASAKAESDSVFENESQPGTGFGNEQYSNVRVVQFDPVTVTSSKYFYKYEWRQTLCKKGIVDCHRQPENRFWSRYEEQYGYAPYPPS